TVPAAKDSVEGGHRDVRQEAELSEVVVAQAVEVGQAAANLKTRHARAAFESPKSDTGKAIRERNAVQPVATCEGGVAHVGHAAADKHAGQVSALREGEVADAGYAVTNRDIRQPAAGIEHRAPDGGQAARQGNAGQVGTALECPLGYGDHAVGHEIAS